jgi:hypothetical protein
MSLLLCLNYAHCTIETFKILIFCRENFPYCKILSRFSVVFSPRCTYFVIDRSISFQPKSLIHLCLHIVIVHITLYNLQLPMQSVPITTEVVSLNRDQARCTHIVIKFVSDLRQIDGFLRVLRFLPPIKLTATI